MRLEILSVKNLVKNLVKNFLAKFLQISKPVQGFSLPVVESQFGVDSSVILPQALDIAVLLLADHLAVFELVLEFDDRGS